MFLIPEIVGLAKIWEQREFCAILSFLFNSTLNIKITVVPFKKNRNQMNMTGTIEESHPIFTLGQ